jgi:hypothetical protein
VNKVLVLVLVASTRAFADPMPPPPPPAITVSPWGSSPYVIAYQPPPEVERAHRGLTVEAAFGAGTTTLDASASSVAFAAGAWVSHDLALAFRISHVGAYEFFGASAQYFAAPSVWVGVGVGNLSERGMDEYGGTIRTSGGGGFVRAGYNLATRGSNALYMSGELQAGAITGQTREVGLFAFGYQFL